MAKIQSDLNGSTSTSPIASLITAYAQGDTPMRVLLDAGEQVTLAEINGGNPITTSPFPFTYNASTFPSGINPSVTSGTPSLAQSTISFGTSTSSQNVVNWTSVLNATNYVLKRSLNSDMSSSTIVYTGALLTYNDTGLTASTTYYYTITASAVGYNNSVSTVANKTTSASSATFRLTFVYTPPEVDETFIDGVSLGGNFVDWPAETYFDATALTVDGFTCSPSTLHVLADMDKNINIALTPVGVSLLSGMVTFLDILNGLHINDTIQKSSDEVWTAEDGNEARVRTKYKCSFGARVAIKITEDTDVEMTFGSYDIFAGNVGVSVVGTYITNKDEPDSVFSPAPVYGDYLIIERLNGNAKVYKTSDGGVTLVEMTSTSPFNAQFVSWIGFIIKSGGELVEPQINANYVIATS